jgi:hypothetical protein
VIVDDQDGLLHGVIVVQAGRRANTDTRTPVEGPRNVFGAPSASRAHDGRMRRLGLLILALSIAALALPSASSGLTFSQSKCDKAKTSKAKKKYCGNASYDKKKCKKAKTSKAKKKYCVKRSAFTTPDTGGQQQTGTTNPGGTNPGGGNTNPGGGPTTTDPGTGTTVQPPSGGKLVRDDAQFAAGLAGYNFHRYEEGSVGYGEYNVNFCPGNYFVYRSYYSINGSAPESNDAGSYSVIEGYTVDTQPGTWLGVVDFALSSGKVVRTVVAYRGTEAQIKSTDDNSIASGIYSGTPGGAQYCN